MTLRVAVQASENLSLVSEAEINRGPHETEQNVLSAAGARGYSAAFEEIWRTHAKQMLRITQRITNNREDAEDALQDSFLRAHIYLHSFDGRSSLATWLTRIAVNSSLMILRKRSATAQLSIDDAGDRAGNAQFVAIADGSPSPEAQFEQSERRATLRLGIRGLPPATRQALEIQVLEDRTVKETAEKMQLSISATKSRIFHAKASLRKSLEPAAGRRAGATRRMQLSPA
jgi:RNA polymerase sigma-70 factor (ECF subfamily)